MKRKISVLDHKAPSKAEPTALFAKARKDLDRERKAIKGDLEAITTNFEALSADRPAKRLNDTDFISRARVIESRLKTHVDRRTALEGQHNSVIKAMTSRRDAQDKELFAHFDRMHGLLSFAIATRNDVPGVIRCLFGELSDYKAAKTREERVGIAKTIRIVLDSDEIRGMDDPKPSILADYDKISDPSAKSRFTPNTVPRFYRRTTQRHSITNPRTNE